MRLRDKIGLCAAAVAALLCLAVPALLLPPQALRTAVMFLLDPLTACARYGCAADESGDTAAAWTRKDWWQGSRRTPAPTAAPAVTEAPTPSPTPTEPPSTATPAPTPTATPATTAPPELKAGGEMGAVAVQRIPQGSGVGYVQLSAGSIRNDTSHSDATLAAAIEGALPFTAEVGSSAPQVLIVHTHATESYQPWEELLYDPAYGARNKDTAQNVCAVGARMAQVLNAAGIRTLHDETLHDSPSYTESYARSRRTVQQYLKDYPSIKIVLDVHRDAIEASGARVKTLCDADGAPTAQVMLIAGCDNGSTVPLPNWELNLRFAAAWEAAMERDAPGLTRPVLCGYRYYNQDLSTGCLLVEVGGHGNTLDEALRAGEYAASSLAALLAGPR